MSRLKFKNPFAKIVIIGSATFCSLAMILQKKIASKMKNTSSYQEAIQILYSEEFPKQYLGEPIVEKNVNFLSSDSYGTEEKIRWIMFGVEGPNKKGYFKYWFSSDDEGHHTLTRVSLLNTSLESVFDKFITPKMKP